jgi:anti-sigma factor (TIGR02949 family)
MDQSKISCKEMFESLSAYVDGDLDESVCEQIRQHTQGCAPCEKFLDSFRHSIEISKVAGKTAGAPPSLPEEVKSVLRAILKQKFSL